MPRKTVSVEYVIDQCNEILRRSTCNEGSRLGVIMMASEILHKTGNYKGFRYLNEEEVPEGQLPGIRWGIGGKPFFENTDHTRINYHLKVD